MILRGWKTLRENLSGKHCFSLFGKERKIGRVENPGENFLSRAHKFCLPKSGRKGEWKIDEEYFVHNALWNQVKIKKKKKKKRRERQRMRTAPALAGSLGCY